MHSPNVSSDVPPQWTNQQNITPRKWNSHRPGVNEKYANKINESVAENKQYGDPDRNYILRDFSRILTNDEKKEILKQHILAASMLYRSSPWDKRPVTRVSSALRSYGMHHRFPHHCIGIRKVCPTPIFRYTVWSSLQKLRIPDKYDYKLFHTKGRQLSWSIAHQKSDKLGRNGS